MANTPTFRIHDWTVKPGDNLIERDTDSIKLQPRTMDVLVCLARHSPEVVSTDELIAEVWHGHIVSDGSIYQRITQLRNAFSVAMRRIDGKFGERGRATAGGVSEGKITCAVRRYPRLGTVLMMAWVVSPNALRRRVMR